MSTLIVNTLKTTDLLHTIDVASISTGGAGTITFPSNTKTFLRGDNTFTPVLALAGADAPLQVTHAGTGSAQIVSALTNTTPSANNKSWVWAVDGSAGGSPGRLSLYTASDALAAGQPALQIERSGLNPSKIWIDIGAFARTMIGTAVDDGSHRLQVGGSIAATLGLDFAATARSIFAPNVTYDLAGATTATTLYTNAAIAAAASQKNYFGWYAPSAVTLTGAAAAAAGYRVDMPVTSSVANTTAAGVDTLLTNVGAGKTIGLRGAAQGLTTHTGVAVGIEGAVTTVAGTDVTASALFNGIASGVVAVHYGVKLGVVTANTDQIDYGFVVHQDAKLNSAALLYQRNAVALTSANFLQFDDIGSGKTFFKVNSAGSILCDNTGQRFNADFTNATPVNRHYFQTITSNQATTVGIIANGTGLASGLQCNGSSDPANAARFLLQASSTGHVLNVTSIGTGTLQDFALQMNSVNNIVLKSSGRILLGNAPTDNAADGVQVSAADLAINTAGRGLRVKEGSNARMGTAVLVAGTVTVANTSTTASTRIFLSRMTTGGTKGHLSTTISAGANFIINSDNAADTSTIAWFLMEPSA